MACTAYYLTAISTSCGSNIPSVKRILVGAFGSTTIKHDMASQTATDYEDVNIQMKGDGTTPVTDLDQRHVIKDIINCSAPATGNEWVEFQFRKNTCSASSEMTVNDNGSFYFTNSINMVFAKQDWQKRLAIQALASGDCSVIYEDGNGNYWMLGLDEPVTLTTASANTGTAVGDSNQYELTMSEDSAVLPVPINAANATTIVNRLLGNN